jgi:tetratricopeptide (TPR) repeat protein
MADIDIQRLDWESALKTFREISSQYPGDEETSIHIVGLHYQLGQDLLARDEIDRYLGVLQDDGESQAALRYLENLRDELPRKVEVRKRLAAQYHQQGQKQKAIGELDALGDMLLDEGRTEEVVEIIEDIIALEPHNVEDYRKLLSQLQPE